MNTYSARNELLAGFFIWRDDFRERHRANEGLKELVSRLSRLVGRVTTDVDGRVGPL